MKKILALIIGIFIVFNCINIGYAENTSYITAYMDYCYFDDSGIYAKLVFDNNDKDSTTYVGVYHTDGYLKMLKKYTLSSGMKSLEFEISNYTYDEGDILRVFFFDLSDGITPLGNCLDFELNQPALSGYISGTYLLGEAVDYGSVKFTCYDCEENDYWNGLIEELGNSSDLVLKCDAANINDFYKIPVKAYVEAVDNNQYKITKLEPESDVCELEIDLYDIDICEDDWIEYYTSESKYDTAKAILSSDAEIYWNYSVTADLTSLQDYLGRPQEVIVRLVDFNSDSNYELVDIREYQYDLVSSVDISKNEFEGVGYSYTVDATVPVTICDINGNAKELSDFSKKDVIGFISSNGRGENYEWIEFLYLGANSVSGTVDEESVDCVYINGSKYYNLVSANLGDEAVFYLTKRNMIFNMEKIYRLPNYGYILGTAIYEEGFSKYWQIKILSNDGTVNIYDVRDEFLLNYNYISSDDTSESAQLLLDLQVNSDISFKDTPDKRLVEYELDSKNKIKVLNSTNVYSFSDNKYYESSMFIGQEILDENTKVFNISGDTEMDAYASNINILIDKNVYSGYYVKNDGDFVNGIIITDGVCNYEKPEISHDYSEPAYGYAYGAAYEAISGFENAWHIKILKSDNEVVVLPCVENVKINGEVYTTDNEIEAAFENIFGEDCISNQAIISYVLMDNKYVSEINMLSADEFENVTYESGSLDGVSITDDTLIFDAAEEMVGTKALVDGSVYSGYAVVGDDGECVCTVITSGITNLPEIIVSSKYAYMLVSAISSVDFENTWQIKILTDAGTEIYSVSKNFSIDGVSYSCDQENVDELIKIDIDSGVDLTDNTEGRVAEISFDLKGRIKSIDFLEISLFEDEVYDEATKTLSEALDENLLVFDVSSNNADYVCAKTISYLNNAGKYSGGLVKNEDGKNVLLIITERGVNLDTTQSLAIVQNVTNIVYNDEDAKIIRYYTNESDELCEAILPEDIDVCEYIAGTNSYDIISGSVIMLKVDEIGIVSSIALIANTTFDIDQPIDENYEAIAVVEESNPKNRFVIGLIEECVKANNGMYITDIYSGERVYVASETNEYTLYNKSVVKMKVYVGDWCAVDSVDIYDSETSEATPFIARVYDGVCKDIITFSERAYVNVY